MVGNRIKDMTSFSAAVYNTFGFKQGQVLGDIGLGKACFSTIWLTVKDRYLMVSSTACLPGLDKVLHISE